MRHRFFRTFFHIFKNLHTFFPHNLNLISSMKTEVQNNPRYENCGEVFSFQHVILAGCPLVRTAFDHFLYNEYEDVHLFADLGPRPPGTSFRSPMLQRFLYDDWDYIFKHFREPAIKIQPVIAFENWNPSNLSSIPPQNAPHNRIFGPKSRGNFPQKIASLFSLNIDPTHNDPSIVGLLCQFWVGLWAQWGGEGFYSFLSLLSVLVNPPNNRAGCSVMGKFIFGCLGAVMKSVPFASKAILQTKPTFFIATFFVRSFEELSYAVTFL